VSQLVVANRVRRGERFLEILLVNRQARPGAVAPDPGEAIRLQFDPD
jgi:hypothetical protein